MSKKLPTVRVGHFSSKALTKNFFLKNKHVFFSKNTVLVFPMFLFFDENLNGNNNKTRTPQVGAISKAQKAQNIFFLEKNLKFSKKNFFRKMSHSAQKLKNRGPFLIYKHAFCSKITKNSKGGPFGDIKKNSKKNLTAPKKIERGGYETLVPSGLVCNV